jgi:hypothetical protein
MGMMRQGERRGSRWVRGDAALLFPSKGSQSPRAHRAQERVEGVLQLHGHTLKRLARALRAQQHQLDRLIIAEHFAGCNLQRRIRNFNLLIAALVV